MNNERTIAFGTDGIRGRAHVWPLDAAGLELIGRALAGWLRSSIGRADVAVGRDTRASGPALQDALVGGLLAGGAQVSVLHVLPTAAVSTAVVADGAGAGVMLTASHNPWHDNGVKIFDAAGRKLDPGCGIAQFFEAAPAPGGGHAERHPDAASSWRAALPAVDLTGLRLMVDAAHGAASALAPAVLAERGAEVVTRGCAPDGRNINEGVGATAPPSAGEVAAAGCALAICLDGDADRLVLVHPQRGLLDGDDLLWLLDTGSGPVVGTIMSNGGLEAALGGRLHRSRVGDRYVDADMRALGAAMGAEPSGHILFADGLPTGDGLYSALRVLAALAGPDGRPELSRLDTPEWTRWPQHKRNLRFSGPRRSLDGLESLTALRVAGHRAVVRYSGTEPLLRIMVEGLGSGDDAPAAWVERIAAEVG